MEFDGVLGSSSPLKGGVCLSKKLGGNQPKFQQLNGVWKPTNCHQTKFCL